MVHGGWWLSQVAQPHAGRREASAQAWRSTHSPSGPIRPIIRAVAGLGASLGISTTAEGVETHEQLDRLRAEGCTEVQGFLFSPPRPAADIMSMLAVERDQAKVA